MKDAKTKKTKKRSEGGARKGKKPPFLTVDPLFLLPLSCFLLFGDRRFFLPALAAAVLHELGHIAAIRLCGGRVRGVSLQPFGGEIFTDGEFRSYRASVLISLSGAAVNLLSALLLFLPELPQALRLFALCSLFLGVFNLLPLSGLDGGDAARSLLLMRFSPETAEKILRAGQIAGALVFTAAAAWAMVFCSFNPALVLLAVYLLFSVL